MSGKCPHPPADKPLGRIHVRCVILSRISWSSSKQVLQAEQHLIISGMLAADRPLLYALRLVNANGRPLTPKKPCASGTKQI